MLSRESSDNGLNLVILSRGWPNAFVKKNSWDLKPSQNYGTLNLETRRTLTYTKPEHFQILFGLENLVVEILPVVSRWNLWIQLVAGNISFIIEPLLSVHSRINQDNSKHFCFRSPHAWTQVNPHILRLREKPYVNFLVWNPGRISNLHVSTQQMLTSGVNCNIVNDHDPIFMKLL